MNVNSWLNRARRKVSPLDAELMMLTALGKVDRSELVLLAERELTSEEMDALDVMLAMRQLHVPMAYLQGWKEFYGLPFIVSPDVLIPRPETEQMIEEVIHLLMIEWPEDEAHAKIVDVGTGSGCIAVSLARDTDAQIVGLDISEKALAIAHKNAEMLCPDAGDRLQFQQSDLLANCPVKADIVVANLPYVDKDWEWTSPEIQFEPPQALFAEDGGLAIIFKLIDQLTTEKCLVLEADPSQHERIIEYARDYKLTGENNYILTFKKGN